MFGGDEVGAMVFDVGSAVTRVGFAGEDVPKAVFPTAVGVIPSSVSNFVGQQSVPVGDEQPSDLGKTHTVPQNRYFVGSSHKKFREHMEITNPVTNGLVSDWDGLERLWDYALKSHLGVDAREHPFLVSEATMNTSDRREKLLEISFEQFNTPAVFLAKSAVLASFSVGRSTALVLDVGAGLTCAAPVHDGYVLHKPVHSNLMAGNALDQMLEKVVFTSRGREPQGRYQFGREVVGPSQSSSLRVTRLALANVTGSFHASACRDVIRDLKETVCRVAETPVSGNLKSSIPVVGYELPDGNMVEIGSERFMVPEALFQPKLAGIDLPALPATGKSSKSERLDCEGMGLSELVSGAIELCDVDIKKELYSNVVLTGGSTLFPGLLHRLSRDLSNSLPPALRVKVHATNTGGADSDRKYGVWIGGSILASLGSFHQMWFSRAEYEEQGGSLLAQKCP